MEKNSVRIFFSRVEFKAKADNYGYFNTRPLLEITGNETRVVDDNEFPTYGTINIRDAVRRGGRNMQDGLYHILKMDEAEVEALEINPKTDGLIMEYDAYQRYYQTLEQNGVCEVLDVSFCSKVVAEYLSWSSEPLNLGVTPFSRNVYLNDRINIMGPFTWEERGNGLIFTPAGTGGDAFMLDRYQAGDCQLHNFFDRYLRVGRTVLLSKYLPASKKVDCIDDAHLKDYMGGLYADSLDNTTRKERSNIIKAFAALPNESVSDVRRKRMLDMVRNGNIIDGMLQEAVGEVMSSEGGRREVVKQILQQEEYRCALHELAKEEKGYAKIVEALEKEQQEKAAALNREIESLQERRDEVLHDYQIAKNKLKKEERKNKGKGKGDKGKAAPVVEEMEIEASSASAETEACAQNATQQEEIRSQLEDVEALQAQLDVERESLRTQTEELARQRRDYESDFRAWRERVVSEQNCALEEVQGKIRGAYASLAFDGPIAGAMAQAAASFEAERRQLQMKAKVHTLSTLSASETISTLQTPAELAGFIGEELRTKAGRKFSQNDIANLLLLISQGFLTIVTGRPGSGKSSLASMMAHVMGLDNPIYPRYQEVSVEKGWSSRRDLVGYYNPLSRAVEASHQGMFNCLSTLDAESARGLEELPYLVLLDDANLSPMEHYWADFMAMCDASKRRRLELGGDCGFNVGSNLRFIATINIDPTTEALSQRLLDRAWLIKLQSETHRLNDIGEPKLDERYPIVPWSLLGALNDSSKWISRDVEGFMAERFNRIAVICANYGCPISPRSVSMIRRYLLGAKGFIDNSENYFEPLDYAVAQKILPLLDGAGEKWKRFLTELHNMCATDDALPRCRKMLSTMLEQGNASMLYYRFLN